jgi:hypothetical protein
MPQDSESGRKAREWGLSTARLVAREIGAEMLRVNSNECNYRGARIVIKCARDGTDSVGVTYAMLKRVKKVYGAFEGADNSFHIWVLSSSEYNQLARKRVSTTRRYTNTGPIGMVQKESFKSRSKESFPLRLPHPSH